MVLSTQCNSLMATDSMIVEDSADSASKSSLCVLCGLVNDLLSSTLIGCRLIVRLHWKGGEEQPFQQDLSFQLMLHNLSFQSPEGCGPSGSIEER